MENYKYKKCRIIFTETLARFYVSQNTIEIKEIIENVLYFVKVAISCLSSLSG